MGGTNALGRGLLARVFGRTMGSGFVVVAPLENRCAMMQLETLARPRLRLGLALPARGELYDKGKGLNFGANLHRDPIYHKHNDHLLCWERKAKALSRGLSRV